MYVQSNYSNNNYSYNISMQKGPKKNSAWNRFTSKIKQKIIDTLPQKDFTSDIHKLDKKKNLDGRISRPMENRIIMGGTAIMTQPAIDYYNQRVDKETRTVSKNRTIAKIIAGTAVGCLVRGSCFRLVEKLTNMNGSKKILKSLLPKDYIKEFAEKPKKLTNYKNALATGIAIIVMCFTNFLFDAPLTAFLTNKLNTKSKKRVSKNEKEVRYA